MFGGSCTRSCRRTSSGRRSPATSTSSSSSPSCRWSCWRCCACGRATCAAPSSSALALGLALIVDGQRALMMHRRPGAAARARDAAGAAGLAGPRGAALEGCPPTASSSSAPRARRRAGRRPRAAQRLRRRPLPRAAQRRLARLRAASLLDHRHPHLPRPRRRRGDGVAAGARRPRHLDHPLPGRVADRAGARRRRGGAAGSAAEASSPGSPCCRSAVWLSFGETPGGAAGVDGVERGRCALRGARPRSPRGRGGVGAPPRRHRGRGRRASLPRARSGSGGRAARRLAAPPSSCSRAPFPLARRVAFFLAACATRAGSRSGHLVRGRLPGGAGRGRAGARRHRAAGAAAALLALLSSSSRRLLALAPAPRRGAVHRPTRPRRAARRARPSPRTRRTSACSPPRGRPDPRRGLRLARQAAGLGLPLVRGAAADQGVRKDGAAAPPRRPQGGGGDARRHRQREVPARRDPERRRPALRRPVPGGARDRDHWGWSRTSRTGRSCRPTPRRTCSWAASPASRCGSAGGRLRPARRSASPTSTRRRTRELYAGGGRRSRPAPPCPGGDGAAGRAAARPGVRRAAALARVRAPSRRSPGRRPRPERIGLATDAETPFFLVVAESVHPWWRATIDGAPLRLLAAEYAFLGAFVRRGGTASTSASSGRPGRGRADGAWRSRWRSSPRGSWRRWRGGPAVTAPSRAAGEPARR